MKKSRESALTLRGIFDTVILTAVRSINQTKNAQLKSNYGQGKDRPSAIPQRNAPCAEVRYANGSSTTIRTADFLPASE